MIHLQIGYTNKQNQITVNGIIVALVQSVHDILTGIQTLKYRYDSRALTEIRYKFNEFYNRINYYFILFRFPFYLTIFRSRRIAIPQPANQKALPACR